MLKHDLRVEKRCAEAWTQTESSVPLTRQSAEINSMSKQPMHSADVFSSPAARVDETLMQFQDELYTSPSSTLLSPTRRLSFKESVDDLKHQLNSNPAEITMPKLSALQSGTTNTVVTHRLTREIRRPISYKETPLNIKVRKSFKFFKFSDSI